MLEKNECTQCNQRHNCSILNLLTPNNTVEQKVSTRMKNEIAQAKNKIIQSLSTALTAENPSEMLIYYEGAQAMHGCECTNS